MGSENFGVEIESVAVKKLVVNSGSGARFSIQIVSSTPSEKKLIVQHKWFGRPKTPRQTKHTQKNSPVWKRVTHSARIHNAEMPQNEIHTSDIRMGSAPGDDVHVFLLPVS